MSLFLITDAPPFNEIPVPLQNGLLVGGSILNLLLKARCTVTTLFYEIPARTSRVVVK